MGTAMIPNSWKVNPTSVLASRATALRARQASSAERRFDSLSSMVFTLSKALFLLGVALTSAMVLRLGSLTLGDLCMLASLGGLVVSGRCELPRGGSPVLHTVAALLIVIGGSLATYQSLAPMQSGLVVLRLLYLIFGMPWQARVLFPGERGLRRFILAYGIGAALCGVATLLQATISPTIIPGTEATNADRFPGLAHHVSDTGGITAMATLIGMGLLGRTRFHWRDLLSAAIFAAGLVGVILSGSVSGMLAVAAGAPIILLTRGLSRPKLMVLLLGGVGAMLGGAAMISQTANGLSPLQRLAQVTGKSAKYQGGDTTASRLVTIRLGWRAFGQHPFTGVGLDPSSTIVIQDLAVHNFVVSLLHDGGLIFAAGVLLALTQSFRHLLANWKYAPLRSVALGAAVAAFFFSLTGPSIFNRYLWIPVAFVAVAGQTGRARQLDDDAPAAPSGRRVLADNTPPAS